MHQKSASKNPIGSAALVRCGYLDLPSIVIVELMRRAQPAGLGARSFMAFKLADYRSPCNGPQQGLYGTFRERILPRRPCLSPPQFRPQSTYVARCPWIGANFTTARGQPVPNHAPRRRFTENKRRAARQPQPLARPALRCPHPFCTATPCHGAVRAVRGRHHRRAGRSPCTN